MKCIAIVVMTILAATNALLISYAGLPYASPLLAHHTAAPAISHFSQVNYKTLPAGYSSFAYSSQVQPLAAYHAYTAPVAYSAPAVIAAPAVALEKLPATYTAQTRGSFHQAPLEGHELSQTSLNVAAAPGTW